MSRVDRDPGLADLVEVIDAAPSGPQTIAFFDVEGTLAAPIEQPAVVDVTPEEAVEQSKTAFRKGGAAALRYEAWELVGAHRRNGHLVVALSSGTPDRAEPIAHELGIEHVLCSEPELVSGRVTGRPAAALTGPAKAEAARRLAGDRGADLSRCFAYADGADDVPLLEAVGHPTAVAPDTELREIAGTRGWGRVDAFDRTADSDGVARTVVSYGGFLASTGIGLVTGLAHRRRRPGVDAMTRVFAEIGPLLSGIDIEVQGAEHARSPRPAVFIINHQSSLVDAIVTFKILRDGFTVVAKKEVRSIPLIGQATWLADWAYVDRVGDRSQARAAISDAVEKLQGGVSVIIAPEGTRSLGPMPGPFKKGAFFMAREAGVPVIPVIMRNAGELMWRDGKALKRGTVEVVVAPPIWCDWTDEELDERVGEVRRLFVDTLENWPVKAASGR